MAKDYHIKGHNTPEMARKASNARKMFGVDDAEHIDILDILEFRLREFYPGFRLIIKRDGDLRDPALTDIPNNQIAVRESVYLGAYDGDYESRYILAHELGHFLLHQEKNSVMHKTVDGKYDEAIKDLPSDRSTERQADMFASHFLIKPKLAFRHKDDPDTLAHVARAPITAAKAMISAAKRLSLRPLTQERKMTFADKRRAEGDELYAEQPRLL